MELRVLKYFLAVARHRNITRAAEELHLTQPTLSRQLQDLEEELGTPLFTREKRRMELTEAGLFLKARAEEMTAIETKTLDQFAHLEDFIAGDVYLGCGETQAVRLVVQALTPLGRAYPQIHFHFVSGNDEQTFDALQKGVLDFGLLCQQTPPADFVYRQVPFDDEWGLYLRRDHPLAQRTSTRSSSSSRASSCATTSLRTGSARTPKNSTSGRPTTSSTTPPSSPSSAWDSCCPSRDWFPSKGPSIPT